MAGLMEKYGGGEVLKRAVRGMLPKNKLRDKRLGRLRTFEGLAHPYGENIYRSRREVGDVGGLGGLSGIGGMGEVQKTFEEAKS